MSNPEIPELSSLSSALDDLVLRIGQISAKPMDPGEDNLYMELVEIERQLQGAQRRLQKLTMQPQI